MAGREIVRPGSVRSCRILKVFCKSAVVVRVQLETGLVAKYHNVSTNLLRYTFIEYGTTAVELEGVQV